MNDEYFDNLENLFKRYVDLDDFKKNYIDVKKPKNSEGLIDQFIRFNQDPLVWKYCRFNDSSDSLKITLKGNYKISDILEFARHYDLSKYKRIIITLKNIDYENIESLERLNKDVYINLYGNQEICTIDQFKNMRSFLNQFKDQYSSYNLSPLELITLAYDFTKFYLYNSGGDKNLYSSRVITKVIESGYIVCVGYCKLFCQLLEEFGIEANMLLTKNKERKDGLGHARVLIQVNDDKYNVSGIYVFDPTWDSERNMVLVEGNDKKLRYKKSSDILGSDRIIEKMPSTIRYLYYMMTMDEFKKRFPNEIITEVRNFKDNIPDNYYKSKLDSLTQEDEQTRYLTIDLLIKILPKIKKIEGYSNEQIERYIENALAIMFQERFKDGFKEKNSDIIYKY